jgi:hypothetical protein
MTVMLHFDSGRFHEAAGGRREFPSLLPGRHTRTEPLMTTADSKFFARDS